MSLAERLGHDLAAATRIAWFAGQQALTARRAGGRGAQDDPAPRDLPSWRAVAASVADLVTRDRAAVAAGLLTPLGLAAPPRDLLRRMRAYLDDVPLVDERRRDRLAQDLPADVRLDALPAYYRRNFHYQTDGYLSARSAALYDWQVETLFTGTARLMRRQALPPIARHLRGRDQRDLSLLDIGCGTGALLDEVARALPRIRRIGIDLSTPYLARAAAGPDGRRHLAAANAERLPLADQAMDVVTLVYLLHEVPAGARAAILAEAARVLRPGGLLVVVDALQTGDVPAFDPLLAWFPARFHEPFFKSWTKTDLAGLAGPLGLGPSETILAHLSKVMVFRKGG